MGRDDAESGPKLSESQQGTLLAAVVRQASVLDRVTEDLLTAEQATGGSLRLDITSVPMATLSADATRLRQKVANLLGNALRYGAAPEG